MKSTQHNPNDDWQLVHAQRASYGSLNRTAIDRLLSPIRDNVRLGLNFVIDLHSATNYGADLLGELVRLNLQLKQHGG
ncbi:MAG: hypothetical protein NXI22_26765, partial [bacterium]|nr:hypothetical protein [bacterium]